VVRLPCVAKVTPRVTVHKFAKIRKPAYSSANNVQNAMQLR